MKSKYINLKGISDVKVRYVLFWDVHHQKVIILQVAISCILTNYFVFAINLHFK